MKRLAIFVLLASSACAQQFGDDHPTGGWLPIPDGCLMKFSKNGHGISRNEGHDFNDRKVTTRKAGAEKEGGGKADP